MKHLDILEKEAINLIREVISTNNLDDICCLYSIGKDSSVLLRLMEKAFFPDKINIKFLHIDTGYKFKEMYEFRDKISKNINLKIYKHPSCLNPHSDGSRYTDIMKTEALKNAIEKYNIKIAFGGARREEEKSRAKERMISIRDKNHRWEPRYQNAEINFLWNSICNENKTLRVFPLSNWTEIDIWEYIKKENIEVVPIYFSHERMVIPYNNSNPQQWIATENNTGILKTIRFRTLGCYPLTAGIESNAKNVDDIINELKEFNYTERVGRAIDVDKEYSMELKKKEGYF